LKTLSIVIVNWNSKDFLRQCLLSLRAHGAALHPQIIVVDGGSFDGCGEMLAGEFPEVEFIQSPDNLGFGRSNNLGVARATGEFLLLLNPDTEIKPGCLEALLAALQEIPGAGLVGARQLNTDGSLQLSSIHRLPTPWNSAFTTAGAHRRYWRKCGAGRSPVPVPVEAVSGACMLLRSDLFRRVGGFTPEYFMYAEDMDLCFKVRRAGGVIWHVPGAVLTHHGGGSTRRQFSKFSTVMQLSALSLYLRRNHGTGAAGRHRGLVAVSALLRLALLVPGQALARLSRRDTVDGENVSLRKWQTALGWALGRESGVAKPAAAAAGSPSGLPGKGVVV
jgi:N-acetylglucosaminyl-diphospho-decaprenol L-rhamnosyltransferase